MVTRQKDEILQDRESLSTEVTKLKTHLEQQQKLLIELGIVLCVIVFSTLYQRYNTVELVQSDTRVF